MKIPARLIGMIVAGVAAPLVAGCAGEVETQTPPVTEQRSELEKQPPSTEPAAAQPPPPATPTAAPPPPASDETPSESTEPEDECPACGMG